ncbi:MAG: histidine kinase N-terminal 7TM domain-containing protein [Pseudomonadales bacterium]|jgi:diguanylate cyclase (GGDEF)-like protein/PAS domain S-box-containing protein|nr:histidine kinase N-terminal 7TM domain-containing protein [Pseudomonadales bacterium]
MWQLTFWSLPSIAATLISAAVALRVWHARDRPGGPALLVLMVAATWWSLGQVASTLVTTVDAKLWAARFQYLGITATPVAWLLFAATYTGRLRRLVRAWPLLALVPVTVTALAFTNDLHGWIWREATLSVHAGYVGWELAYGPAFRLHTLWAYALVGAGVLVMLDGLIRSPWHRRRLGALLGAPLLVLAANFFYLVPGSPLPWLDLTPLGFALAGGLFSTVLTRELFDLVPVSRELVMRDLPDAVFVLARSGRVVDLNPAALALAGRAEADAVGRPLWDLLPVTREQLDAAPAEGTFELTLELGGATRAFRVGRTEVRDPRGERAGRALVFHDHTDRWHAERELRDTAEALERAHRELERLTTLDGLTRLPHRRAFLRTADEEMGRARRYDRGLSLLLVSLDRLGAVDATFGADAADEIVRGLATLLETNRRDGDHLGRVSGGEFALLLPETDLRRAGLVADRLRRVIARTRFRNGAGEAHALTTSMGLVGLRTEDRTADELLQRARQALAAARAAGEDRVGYA